MGDPLECGGVWGGSPKGGTRVRLWRESRWACWEVAVLSLPVDGDGRPLPIALLSGGGAPAFTSPF